MLYEVITTDMSYGKVTHPSHICKVGDTQRVKVIRFDRVITSYSIHYTKLYENREDKYMIIVLKAGATGQEVGLVEESYNFV